MLRNTLLKKFEPLYLIAAIVVSILFVHLSTICYFADSEIWLLTASQRVLHVKDLVSIYYKWGFHLLVYLFSHFAPTEVDVYGWARIGCAFVALCAAGLTSAVFTRVFEKRKMFFPLFIFLLTSSLFFNQAFRIRADIFSYFFHILIVWYLLRMRDRFIYWQHHVLLFFLNILLIASGPKMIFFFIAQFTLAILIAFKGNQHGRKRFFWFIWLGHLLCVSFFAFLGTISYFVDQLPHVPLALALALKFFLSKFDNSIGTPRFFEPESFQYFTNFLILSWPHAFVLFFGVFTFLLQKNRRAQPPAETLRRQFFIYAFLLFLFAMIHNDKLPFFLGPMITPLLAFSFLFCGHWIEKNRPQNLASAKFVTLAFCLYVAITQYQINSIYNANFLQKDFIATLENYFKKHESFKIYDVVGLLPRANKVFTFVGPGEEDENTKLVNSIKVQAPDVVIYTFKAKMLEPQFHKYLSTDFVAIESDVWAKGRNISLLRTPRLFQKTEVIKGTRYWVLRSPPEKYIYDVEQKIILNPVILHLDAKLKITTETPHFVAIPMEHIFLGLTNFEPPNFPIPASKLFRFDTGF